MIRSVSKFLRIKILFTCYTIVFLGSAATGAITLSTVLAIFVLAAWYLHAASSNDYADRHIDKINLKSASDRPYIAKAITDRQLWIIHAISGGMALILACFYGIGAVIFTLVILFLDYAYSFKPLRLSYRGVISQLVLPIAYVYYPFTLGYWAAMSVSPYPWLLSVGLYFGFVARLFLKDFRDVKGDKRFGKMTYLLRHGPFVTCVLSGIFSSVSLLIMAYVINFSFGILAVLVFGHIQAMMLLKQLTVTKKIAEQVRLIRQMARLANIAVLTVLAYFIFGSQSSALYPTSTIIPALIGATLLIFNQFTHKSTNA